MKNETNTFNGRLTITKEFEDKIKHKDVQKLNATPSEISKAVNSVCKKLDSSELFSSNGSQLLKKVADEISTRRVASEYAVRMA